MFADGHAHAEIAWSDALDRALTAVARARRLDRDTIGVETENEVAEALAIALLALADADLVVPVRWPMLRGVAVAELSAVARHRATSNPPPRRQR